MAGCNWAPGPVAIAGQVKGARGSLPPHGAPQWQDGCRLLGSGHTDDGTWVDPAWRRGHFPRSPLADQGGHAPAYLDCRPGVGR